MITYEIDFEMLKFTAYGICADNSDTNLQTKKSEQLCVASKVMRQLMLSVSGECYDQFQRERSGSQRFGDFAHDLLGIRHLLVTQSDLVLLERHRRTHHGFRRLVLPLHRGAGSAQQLHQPFHLRRQVSRFQDGRQEDDEEERGGGAG